MKQRRVAPVPSRRALAVVWLAATIGFVGLLFVARRLEGPRDDPDQAEQRVGFLDEGMLPIAAPVITAGLPAAGRATVVVFLRPADAADECTAMSRQVGSAAALVAVLSGPAPCPGIPAVHLDPEGRTAAAYGMRAPVDRGPSVGYAVVDSETRVRYRTLDPHPAANSREVLTILRAL